MLLVCAVVPRGAAAIPPECSASRFDTAGVAEFVIDGDTVILADATHVRLIGVDTPELGRDGAGPEPGAVEARAFLTGLLPSRGRLWLVHDAERHDRYGRLLAHLFLPDGSNVQARLLEEGHAVPLTIPPNLLFLDCYRRAADEAARAGRGLWGLKHYQPGAAEDLDPERRGYGIIHGRVTRIGRTGSSIWLELGTRFALRIAREDFGYFAEGDLSELLGRPVRARGIIYRSHGQLRMRVRHPVDLSALPERSGNH